MGWEDSGIFQRESNDGSGGLLTYFKDGAIGLYVAKKVEECWLKLRA